jgi:hypothetical protein
MHTIESRSPSRSLGYLDTVSMRGRFSGPDPVPLPSSDSRQARPMVLISHHFEGLAVFAGNQVLDDGQRPLGRLGFLSRRGPQPYSEPPDLATTGSSGKLAASSVWTKCTWAISRCC